jgi:Sulfotransferase family
MPLLRRQRAASRSHPVHPPAPFVVGAARSGTTMLRLMLDAHSELAIPPETQFVPELIDAAKDPSAGPTQLAEMLVTHRRFADFGLDGGEVRRAFAEIEPFEVSEAIRAFFSLYAAKERKPRWGDKTPGYALCMRKIHRNIPEARFIHLIRDGRDVRLSQLGRGSDHPSPEQHARRWRRRVQKARDQGEYLPHYIEVRYEDLVADPESQLRRLCEFCSLDWDSDMLHFHERAASRLEEIARPLAGGEKVRANHQGTDRSAEERVHHHRLTSEPPRKDRIAQWRTKMSASDQAAFEAEAGDLLAELGYEVGTGSLQP